MRNIVDAEVEVCDCSTATKIHNNLRYTQHFNCNGLQRVQPQIQRIENKPAAATCEHLDESIVIGDPQQTNVEEFINRRIEGEGNNSTGLVRIPLCCIALLDNQYLILWRTVVTRRTWYTTASDARTRWYALFVRASQLRVTVVIVWPWIGSIEQSGSIIWHEPTGCRPRCNGQTVSG